MAQQFFLYQSNSLEKLAEHFAVSQRNQRKNPLQPQEVILQTTGMKTWLTQKCTDVNGIFAAVKFTTPVEFLLSINAKITGKSEQKTVFESDNLRWFIFTEMQKNGGDYPLVQEYLSSGESSKSIPQQKLFAFAIKTAELFDSYMLYRPDMLNQWKANRFAQHEGKDLFSSQLREHEQWQQLLWQRLCKWHDAYIQHEEATQKDDEKKNLGENPVDVLTTLGQILEEGSDVRLIKWAQEAAPIRLFGMSLLPPRYMELFKLLSQYVPVEIYVTNPSCFYWGDLLTDRQIKYRRDLAQRRNRTSLLSNDIDTAHIHTLGNTLLRNLGMAGRDFFHTLYSSAESIPIEEVEEFVEPLSQEHEGSLLQHIQQDILLWRDEDRREERIKQQVSLTHDTSLVINRCYTPLREVEVLKDYLYSCFESDPTLTLGDVLIVTPNLEAYAPLFSMLFSYHSKLRGSVADRSLLAENSLLMLVKEMLTLPETRFSAPLLLSLFEQYHRFVLGELSLQDQQKLTKWIGESGIVWGIDGDFYERQTGSDFGKDRFTWRSGLDRILQGYATGAFEGDSSAYSEVEGSDGILLGKLAAFVRRMAELEHFSRHNSTINQWKETLERWFQELFLYDEGRHEDEAETVLSKVIGALSRLEEQVHLAHSTEEVVLNFSTVRSALVGMLDDGTAGDSFLRGTITFASTIPLRSIPFKIIGFVGMEYTSFPRLDSALSFDLMVARPFKGDRTVRNNDLFLFLESLGAAQEKLYLSFSGFDPKSGEEIPPSSVIEQLLSYIDENYVDTTLKDTSPSKYLVQNHPLHPFSYRYCGDDPRLFTYASRWFEKMDTVEQKESLLTRTFEGGGTISFHALLSYLKNPLEYLYTQLLRYTFAELSPSLRSEDPLEVDNLQQWAIRNAMVQEAIGDDGVWHAKERELYYASITPPGVAGEALIETLETEATNFLDRIPAAIRGKERVTIVREGILEGEAYTLESAPFYEGESEAILVDVGKISFSKNNSTIHLKRYFTLYLTHLLLNSERRIRTKMICRDKTVWFEPFESDQAVVQLEQILKLFQESQKRFLPYLGAVSLLAYVEEEPLAPVLEKRVLEPGYDNAKNQPRKPDLYEKLFYEQEQSNISLLDGGEWHDKKEEIAETLFGTLTLLQGGKNGK